MAAAAPKATMRCPGLQRIIFSRSPKMCGILVFYSSTNFSRVAQEEGRPWGCSRTPLKAPRLIPLLSPTKREASSRRAAGLVGDGAFPVGDT